MNAYYQIINDESGTKLKLFPATDGGREMVDLQELMDYLSFFKIPFQAKDLAPANTVLKESVEITLSSQRSMPIPEDFRIEVMEGNMRAILSRHQTMAPILRRVTLLLLLHRKR